VWFAYEPRQELKGFLCETLRLWSTLAMGNNTTAIKHIATYLSFDQVRTQNNLILSVWTQTALRCIIPCSRVWPSLCWQVMEVLHWRYEPTGDPGTLEQSTIFADLLLHLYVHTSPADFALLTTNTKFVDDKGQLVRPTPRASASSALGPPSRRSLDALQLTRVKLFVNEFVVGGRMASEEAQGTYTHNPLDLPYVLRNPAESPRLLDLALSVVRLLRHMLLYQHYSAPQELSDLRIALLHSLSKADTPTRGPQDERFVELRVLMVHALARVLDVRVNNCVADFVALCHDARLGPDAGAAQVRQLILEDREALNDAQWATFVSEGTRVCQRAGRGRRLGVVLEVDTSKRQVKIRWDGTTPLCLLSAIDQPAPPQASGQTRARGSSAPTMSSSAGADWVAVGPGSSPDLRVARYSSLRKLLEPEEELGVGSSSDGRRTNLLRGAVLDAVMTGEGAGQD
jgi:hypothetical protein